MKLLLAGLASLVFATTANAVEYTLPSGPNVSLAQLQSLPDYTTVCDTNSVLNSPCDVEPGRYQLVVFDELWQDTVTQITIDSDTPDSNPLVTLVTESCFGGPNTKMGCTAFCPNETVATGGACDVSDGFTVSAIAGPNFYRCPTALPANDNSVGVTASVYCLGTK